MPAPTSVGGYGIMSHPAAIASDTMVKISRVGEAFRWTCFARVTWALAKQRTARSGVRARPFDVSTLISRGLERNRKNMRKMLNINVLQIELQVFDFSLVRSKKGVFRCNSHP
jgi:hypothetical protein